MKYEVTPEVIEQVVCYIRVSTKEQKLHGLSLDAQRDTLRRYAEENGLKIVGWYEDEGVSGRKLIRKRPALQRMLNDAQEGKFSRILFIKLDRYFRSVAEYHECQKILEQHKVLWTATEERYDLTTASGRYWVTQKLAMAEYEADNTGERIRLVNEYKIRTGQPLTGTQSQGVAYTVIKDAEGVKRVVPDPETKDMVMDYINHFLVHQNKRQAYRYVKDKYNTEVSYDTLGRVLIDTKIYGHYRGNDSYCESYVDKATYDKIQRLLSKNIRTNQSNRTYLFSGLIPCPVCGRLMAGVFTDKQITRKKSGKVYHSNREYHTYRCNATYTHDICTYRRRPNEAKIEAALLKSMESYINAYIYDVEVEDATADRDNEQITKKITQLKSEMTRLNNMFRKSRISEAEYDKDYEVLEAALKDAESHLEPRMERDTSMYRELIESDWRALYEGLNRENKQAFWRKYVKALVIDEKGALNKPIFF